MTTDNKAYLGEILTGEQARATIGEGLWREIDLPGHPGAAMVVWRMEEDTQRSPAQELNARKLVAGFNVCETGLGSCDQSMSAAYGAEQEAAERPAPVMTLLQAAKKALEIAEDCIKDELEGTRHYLPAMAKLDHVRAAIKAAGGST